MHWLSVDTLAALLTLTALEIVLGMDNIVFVVVVTSRLPQGRRETARRLGMAMAMLTRLALLFAISRIMRLSSPLFSVLHHAVTARDLVLLLGGLFLLYKGTAEIHDKLEGENGSEPRAGRGRLGTAGAVAQIAILDIVFSLDSVITAVGMARDLWVMSAAIVAAVAVMLFFARVVSDFVSNHPTLQMLAFAFLLLVGVFLVAEGLGQHIDRAYIYFAMAFSLFVETLNIRMRRKRENGSHGRGAGRSRRRGGR
ncbi:Integral membrane protein TerC [Desulfovibrio sp. X2]|uniref:TerC family protein n=1 Tax=Desulfovibrio sp. X2 TaxID=941449 RepID=UPI0003587FC0|nr:TerC family protein [Desulfovibrio sp. X2]EPR37502.1 Integral membrane protein TerC [Desulfovibrio sp. X2]